MKRAEDLPINCVARNAVWAYPRVVESRFPGGRALVETTRSYEMPELGALHEGADVSVELYGGALSYRLDGESRRVYVGRFSWASYDDEEAARAALLDLWGRIRLLDTVPEVEEAVRSWSGEQKRGVLPAA